MIDDEDGDVGEDERSIASHVRALTEEVEKTRPNMEMLQQKMTKTLTYRKKFIQDHTTREVMEEFPCLRIPKMVRIYTVIVFFTSVHVQIQHDRRIIYTIKMGKTVNIPSQ